MTFLTGTLVERARGKCAPTAALVCVALAAVLPACAQDKSAADTAIRQLIAKYAAAADAADPKLAGEVWEHSPDVSFINPAGREHGWDEVQGFYTKIMGGMFTERKLNIHDPEIHVYGDAAWAEFDWDFVATMRANAQPVHTRGRETQIYRRTGPDRWVLVHVHYSEMPRGAAARSITPVPLRSAPQGAHNSPNSHRCGRFPCQERF